MSAAGPRGRALALAVVAFGVFVAGDDLFVVSTMLRPIIDDVGLVLPDDLDSSAWIVNVYLIAYVAVMPLAGRLSDVLGRRAVFVGSLAVFLVGSVVVPLADGLPVLLTGRVLTALGGGALVPVGMAVVGDLYPEPGRARALGLIAGIGTLGWVWGPLYGALLVRYLTWEWQFWLNVPLAVIGAAGAWVALDRTRRAAVRIDWPGATLLTVGLVALNVALLREARIQTVAGLEELTGGGGGSSGRWLYLVAAVAIGGFVVVESRVADPLIDLRALLGRRVGPPTLVNGLIGAGIVITVVNVPLYVNVVEGGLRESAVIAGWLLTAFTGTMAAASYAGGRLSTRLGHRVPAALGLAVAAAAFARMGATWDEAIGHAAMGLHLALLGAGIGLVVAPTTDAVVDAAGPERRGAFSGLVLQARLVGFSIGLAGLTAWGAHRYNEMRAALDLPPLGAPGAAEALAAAQTDITRSALAETFLGAAVLMAVALVVALTMPPAIGERPARTRRGRDDARSPSGARRDGRLGSA